MTDANTAIEPATDAAPVPRPVSSSTFEALEAMVALIPDADEGSGLDRLMAQIVGADDLSDLDAPWRTSDMEQYLEQTLLIESIAKRPSDYGDALPFFLVVTAVVQETGERVTITTGSQMVVAQLAKANVEGWLPALAVVAQSDKPTKAGFYPQHLAKLRPAPRSVNDTGRAV